MYIYALLVFNEDLFFGTLGAKAVHTIAFFAVKSL